MSLVSVSLATILSAAWAPVPPARPFDVKPGHYRIQNGGIWDFNLRKNGTLIATHPYSDIFYSGTWMYDRETRILILRTISSPGGSEKWNEDRIRVEPTGAFHVDSEIRWHFERKK